MNTSQEHESQHNLESKKEDFDPLELHIERFGLLASQVHRLNVGPSLLEVDVGRLHSKWLQNHPTFHFLIGQIQRWNQEVKASDESGVRLKHAVFRNNLYKTLGQQLHEVVQTQDRASQFKFVDQVAQWFHKQNRIVTGNATDSFVSEQQNRRQSIQENSHSESLQEPMISRYAFNHQEFYHRTKYPDLDPAEDRVKDYKRSSGPHISSPSTTRPGTSDAFAGGMSSTNFFSRPITRGSEGLTQVRPGTQMSRNFVLTPQSGYRPDTAMMSQSGLKNNSMLTSAWAYSGTGTPHLPNFSNREGAAHNGSQQSDEESKEYVPPSVVPDRKVYIIDKKLMHLNFLPKKNYRPKILQRQTEMAYNNEDKGRKFAEMRSTFIHYAPSTQVQELRMEAKWLANRNRELRHQRESEEVVQYITSWANNKGIMEQEINKRNELAQYGSHFSSLGFQRTIETQHEDDQEVQERDFEVRETRAEREARILQCYSPGPDGVSSPTNQSLSQITRKPQTAAGKIETGTLEDEPSAKMLQSMQEEQQSLEGGVKNQQVGATQNQKINTGKNVKFIDFSAEVPVKKQEHAVEDAFQQFVDHEIKKKRLRVEHIRSTRGALIDARHAKREDVQDLDTAEIERRMQNSISVFSKKNSVGSAVPAHLRNYKPFSTMYRTLSTQKLIKEQIEEVHKIKNTVNRTGLRCSMQTLSQAFVTPLGLAPARLKEIAVPQTSSRLMQNPFLTAKKKTGKKKQ